MLQGERRRAVGGGLERRARFSIVYYLWVLGLDPADRLGVLSGARGSRDPVQRVPRSRVAEPGRDRGADAAADLRRDQAGGRGRQGREWHEANCRRPGARAPRPRLRLRTRRRLRVPRLGTTPTRRSSPHRRRRRRGASTSPGCRRGSPASRRRQQQQREREEAFKRQFTVIPLNDPNLVSVLQSARRRLPRRGRHALAARPVLQLDPAVPARCSCSGASSCSAWVAARKRCCAWPRASSTEDLRRRRAHQGPLHGRGRCRRGRRGSPRDRLVPEGARRSKYAAFLGAKLPTGVLLAGRRAPARALLARAIGEADVPFFSSSATGSRLRRDVRRRRCGARARPVRRGAKKKAP